MQKIENSIFQPYVNAWMQSILPHVPTSLTANKITVLGLVCAALACLSLYYTHWSRWMCLLGAFFVFLHWFGDTLDGVVARARGATKLGYYLDNFCDALSVLFIGIGAFLTVGSHFEIGVATIVLYQLHVIHGLAKAELTRVVVLPVYGPTEIHLTIIGVLTAQTWLDFGRPLSWFPSFSGDEGWLTMLLGFDRGLTFVDVFGVFMVLALGVMLVFEIIDVNREFGGGA